MQIKLQIYNLSFLIIFISMVCCASPEKSKEEQAIKQLLSESWQVREQGIYFLSDTNVKLSKKSQKELVSLLEKEIMTYMNYKNKLMLAGKSSIQISEELYNKFPPQTYGDYIKALVTFIISKNITDSLPSAFQLLVDSDYNISPAFLTLYGTGHLDFFTEKSLAGTNEERKIAISVIGIWANPEIESDDVDMSSVPHLNKSEMQKVKSVLLSTIKDNDGSIRSLSLFGLRAFADDDDVKSIVSKMAESDVDEYVRKDALVIFNRRK